MVKVFVAVKKYSLYKMAGRHTETGVISKIAPIEDMPYRGWCSRRYSIKSFRCSFRMNVGQILETHFGLGFGRFGK